ncbi:hypothetical protein AMTRI_Chr03g148390 [Amborella trichopoda]
MDQMWRERENELESFDGLWNEEREYLSERETVRARKKKFATLLRKWGTRVHGPFESPSQATVTTIDGIFHTSEIITFSFYVITNRSFSCVLTFPSNYLSSRARCGVKAHLYSLS